MCKCMSKNSPILVPEFHLFMTVVAQVRLKKALNTLSKIPSLIFTVTQVVGRQDMKGSNRWPSTLTSTPSFITGTEVVQRQDIKWK